MDTPALANDKYRATLRATFIDGVDTTIQVTAIPVNLPTNITIGWNTQYETEFRVTGTSGSNSSNYALTGITKIKGYTGNLPENTAVNCLNNEEFFNQYSSLIAAAQDAADAAVALATAAAPAALTTNSIVSSATPSPIITTDRNFYFITALGAAAAFAVPTGTPHAGQTLVIRIKDDGIARALTYNAIYRAIGVTLPPTTVISKTLYIGAVYNAVDSKWDVLAVQQQA